MKNIGILLAIQPFSWKFGIGRDQELRCINIDLGPVIVRVGLFDNGGSNDN